MRVAKQRLIPCLLCYKSPANFSTFITLPVARDFFQVLKSLQYDYVLNKLLIALRSSLFNLYFPVVRIISDINQQVKSEKQQAVYWIFYARKYQTLKPDMKRDGGSTESAGWGSGVNRGVWCRTRYVEDRHGSPWPPILQFAGKQTEAALDCGRDSCFSERQ